MSDNPLETSPAREKKIEARAKRLWEDAGQTGSMDDYREQADELVRMEMAGPTGQLPADGPSQIIEEASIQENLGEFPGARGFADQGEFRETPMTREELKESEEADKK